jgi:hypothetical protein
VTAVGGVVVVVAVVGVDVELPCVVEVVPEDAVAITGDAGEPDGAVGTMPVAAELFGYGLHSRFSVLPETTSPREILGSTVRVMAPPVAVKGPMVVAGDGRFNVIPVTGMGLGNGALMVRLPLESDAGLAPVASTLVTAVPEIEEFPSAWAAEAIELGRTTVDE